MSICVFVNALIYYYENGTWYMSECPFYDIIKMRGATSQNALMRYY